MNPSQSQQYLKSFINNENYLDRIKPAAFKLERMQALLKNLGDPQKYLKIIHVAGSKGKGSVCALTASVLQSSGYRVGLYTSPHIKHYRERIRVCNIDHVGANGYDLFPDMISEHELCKLIEEVKPAIEQIRFQKNMGRLTFFEVITALALVYFKKQGVDCAILETGLGGRLDATNAVNSMMAVLMPISLEHTQLLGATEAAIAGEKAAIIKGHKQKVIVAPQGKQAREIIQNRCLQFEIDPLWVGDAVRCDRVEQSIECQTFDLTTEKSLYKQISLSLLGHHQRDNCAVAISIVEYLQAMGFVIPLDAIYEGFKNVFWPGRFEIVQSEPLVILDAAHNQASMGALADLCKETLNNRRVVCILGISRDKDINAILKSLEKITTNIIYSKANHPRAHVFPDCLDVRRALELANQKTSKEDVILVTGSIFIISEVRSVIQENKNRHQCPSVPASQ